MPRKRTVLKQERKKKAEAERKKRGHVNVAERVSASDLKRLELLREYFERGDKQSSAVTFIDILLEARKTAGSLKGKRVLMISPDKKFASYLKEIEGAKVRAYGGLVQGIGRNLKEGGFKLIIANRIFESHAFEHFIIHEDGKIWRKALQRKSFQRHLDRKQPGRHSFSRFERRKLEVKEVQRFERIDILRQLRDKLEKGGYFIATGSSSKLLFKPGEATKAGFKIIKINEQGQLVKWPVTVLQKK